MKSTKEKGKVFIPSDVKINLALYQEAIKQRDKLWQKRFEWLKKEIYNLTIEKYNEDYLLYMLNEAQNKEFGDE